MPAEADTSAARCPICDGSSVSVVASHPDFQDTRILHCSDCTHWFASPEPSGQTLDAYYRTHYSEHRRRHFGEPYFVLMERRADAQVRYIRCHLDREEGLGTSPGWGKVLDLGCGVGALVACLQGEGADAIGYDSDPAVIEIGKARWNANVHLATSNDASTFRGQFDLMCMSHVIEHLPTVSQTLPSILQILVPGGHVFFEAPNCFAGMFSGNVNAEAHLNFFTRGSLHLLLERAGLHVMNCVTCGPHRKLALEPATKPKGVALRVLSKLQGTIATAAIAVSSLRKDSGAHVRTAYDGTYARYYPGDEGLWVRCLARKA